MAQLRFTRRQISKPWFHTDLTHRVRDILDRVR